MTVANPNPLLVPINPIAGESLLSLLVRACQANLFDHPGQLLRHAGIVAKANTAPFVAGAHAQALANLLGVSTAAVQERLHGPCTRGGRIAWNGVSVERRFIDGAFRRVAPASLRHSGHHRLLWTHKALSFCPETFQSLISHCLACGAALRWGRTKGLDRCETCAASLLKQEPSYVDESLRASAGAAAGLIAHDAEVRTRALRALPAVFQDWPPEEVFTAAIRFGTAWEHPYLRAGEQTARSLGNGRLSFLTPTHLARGHDVLANWPTSFVDLVDRIGAEQVGLLGEQTASLRRHGVFANHFKPAPSAERFGALVRSHALYAALRTSAPFRISAAARVSRKDPQGLLTLTQAGKQLHVSKRVLSRLVPDGESYANGRLGPGGCVYLHELRLRTAVEAFKSSLPQAAVAQRLGIPSYMVPEFERRGFVQSLLDPDALRLGVAMEPRYTEASVAGLTERVGRIARDGDYSDCSIQIGLARQFSPSTWASVLQDALDSDRRGWWCDTNGSSWGPKRHGLFGRLMLEQDSAAQFIKENARADVPDAVVTAAEASILLGIDARHVGSLIAARRLVGAPHEQGWRIRLSDLMIFDRLYITASEHNQRTGLLCPSRFGQEIWTLPANSPELSVPGLPIWPRDLYKEVFL